MQLPTMKTQPQISIDRMSVLLYGPPKCGKTTTAAEIPKALFLAAEPGLSHLEVYRIPHPDEADAIRSWSEFLDAIKAVLKGDHGFTTIVVDTIDAAYDLCTRYICRKHQKESVQDFGGYGAGWALVRAEFKRAILALANCPQGLWLISHSKEKEMPSRTGDYQKTTIPIPGRAAGDILGLVDLILLVDIVVDADGEEKRIIRTKPSRFFDAGDRTGRLPAELPLSYAALVEAFADGGE